MINEECLHETLYFGSGDYYLICRACSRYWRMEDHCTNNVGEACKLSGQDRVTARPEGGAQFKGWTFEPINADREKPPEPWEMTRFWGIVRDEKGQKISHIGQADAEALLRLQGGMTEARAREILGACGLKIEPDGELAWEGHGPFTTWSPGCEEAILDGEFTADKLEAIAFFMRLAMNSGERNG